MLKTNFGTDFVVFLHSEFRLAAMKKYILFLIITLFIFACSSQKVAIKANKTNNENNDKDSIEYAMETFDSKFDSWYLMQEKSEATSSTKEYYEYWNQRYVAAWNSKAASGQYGSFFEPINGYEPNIDYGFELNHKLFYYFQYVENVLKIDIMPGSPHVVRH